MECANQSARDDQRSNWTYRIPLTLERMRRSRASTIVRREAARDRRRQRTLQQLGSPILRQPHRSRPALKLWRAGGLNYKQHLAAKSDRQYSGSNFPGGIDGSIGPRAEIRHFAAAIVIVQGCAARQPSPSKPGPAATAVPSVTPTPTGAALGTHAPFAITAGLDGNLWFTEYQGDGIGRITPYGATKRFKIDPGGFAERITAGPDGAVWFTDTAGNRIGRVAPEGKIAYVKLPHAGSGPAGITAGPDGNLWFTEHSGNRIGRLSTTGTLTEIELPKGTGPAEIVAGSDGNLWLGEDQVNRIARVTVSGSVKEFQILTPHSSPAMMTLGADGNVWFTQPRANEIGRITPGGYITEFALPSPGVPLGIAAGADKNLWVTVIRAH